MKAVGRALLPPVLVEFATRPWLGGNAWSGDYRSWADAVAASSGYDDTLILERVEAATKKVENGEAVYERDSVVFDQIDYSWPLLAGLMWIAARNGGRLDVLDYGGALGSTYRQNRHFLNRLAGVEWSVVEQHHFVESGKRSFEDERLRFYQSIDECLAVRAPQVIVLSSVLQYLEKPHELLHGLAGRFPFVLIDMTPVHSGPSDRLTVQVVPPSIYPARYPCWIFSEAGLLASLKPRFDITASFDSHLGAGIRIGWMRAHYRGFILEHVRSTGR